MLQLDLLMNDYRPGGHAMRQKYFKLLGGVMQSTEPMRLSQIMTYVSILEIGQSNTCTLRLRGLAVDISRRLVCGNEQILSQESNKDLPLQPHAIAEG